MENRFELFLTDAQRLFSADQLIRVDRIRSYDQGKAGFDRDNAGVKVLQLKAGKNVTLRVDI